ncbi:MAG: rod shape-determining protein MreD [Chloroflexota bacterium]
MRYAIAFVVSWLLAVANVSAFSYIKVLGVTPDFVLIFAACWAVVRGEPEALFVVPVAGLARDLTTSDPLGTSMLAFVPIVLLAAVARQQVIDSDFPPAIAVVAAGTLAFGIIQSLVLALTGESVAVWEVFLRVIVPGIVVNALFTPIVYLPVRWSNPRFSGLRGSRGLASPYS